MTNNNVAFTPSKGSDGHSLILDCLRGESLGPYRPSERTGNLIEDSAGRKCSCILSWCGADPHQPAKPQRLAIEF